MGSPIGDRTIIDIKVEKYKQIVPDNYIGRHVISLYDTYRPTATRGIYGEYMSICLYFVAAVNIFLLILLLLLRFCFDRALIIFIIYDLA